MVRTKLQYQHLEKIKIRPRICRISKYRNRATKERQSIARSRLGHTYPAQMRKYVLYLHRYVKSPVKY
jgi:hypothetical protein